MIQLKKKLASAKSALKSVFGGKEEKRQDVVSMIFIYACFQVPASEILIQSMVFF